MKDKEASAMIALIAGKAVDLVAVSAELKEHALANVLSYRELQVKMRQAAHRLDVFLREFPDVPFVDQPETGKET